MQANHIHCVIRATVGYFPGKGDEEELQTWLRGLIDNLGMKAMSPIMAVYNEREGLRGWSAVVLIETSHIVIHSWDEDPEFALLEFDVYTCGEFDMQVVDEALKTWLPHAYSWKTFDRSTDSLAVISRGHKVF